MTGRTLALVVAALVLPALWGWLVPGLLARAWPRREPPPSPGAQPPVPDYEI